MGKALIRLIYSQTCRPLDRRKTKPAIKGRPPMTASSAVHLLNSPFRGESIVPTATKGTTVQAPYSTPRSIGDPHSSPGAAVPNDVIQRSILLAMGTCLFVSAVRH